MRDLRLSACALSLFVSAAACKSKKHAEEKSEAPPAAATGEVMAVGVDPDALNEPAPIAPPPDLKEPPSNAEKTPSGLVTKKLAPGAPSARSPGPADRVRIRYTGWTKDGAMFDSTERRGEPATMTMDRVIPGFREALAQMVEGERRRVWVPAKLGYGESPLPGQPAGDLVFDLELVSVLEAPVAPKEPERPPANATTTGSGLAYQRLRAGTGDEHPTAASRVKVHYSGWTASGELFDSSVVRGSPATFRVEELIPGWSQGLELMVEGEMMRFWIPAALAYGDKSARPGAPSGDLVFDVELIAIE